MNNIQWQLTAIIIKHERTIAINRLSFVFFYDESAIGRYGLSDIVISGSRYRHRGENTGKTTTG